MWQRFTERARRVVFFAQEEAGRLGENYVSTEHLLLGLVRENDSIAARILDRIGVSPGRIRREIERQVARGEGRTGQDMQLTPRAKRVIDLAHEEAKLLKDDYIDSEHLLLGLIREGEGLAGRVLNKLGVELQQTREEVLLITGPDRREGPVSRKGETVPVRSQVGDLGTLRGEVDRRDTEVAIDAAAFADLACVRLAKDRFGYREMREQGRFFLAPVGTRVKRLEPGEAEPPRAIVYGGSLFVRLLEGEFAGRTGWIAADEFERIGEDDGPFPPDL